MVLQQSDQTLTVTILVLPEASLMSLAAQATGLDLPSQLLSSLPYLVTIIVLGIISADRRLLKLNGVASLGEPFER